MQSHLEKKRVFKFWVVDKKISKIYGKISAQPHTTLSVQFLDKGNNDKYNTLPLGKQICFTIVLGCAEIFYQIYVSI